MTHSLSFALLVTVVLRLAYSAAVPPHVLPQQPIDEVAYPTHNATQISATDGSGIKPVRLRLRAEVVHPNFNATQKISSNGGSGIKLVRLRLRHARTTDNANNEKSFYTTRVFAGKSETQGFRMSLDTASGQVVLPASECSSRACLEHKRYWYHESGIEVNADGSRIDPESTTSDAMTIGFSSMDLGDGSLTGILVNDSVCLNLGFHETPESKHCTNVSMVAATSLTDVPFRSAPYDGTLGLGLQGLSLRKGFNFLSSLGMHADMKSNQFALYYGQHFGEAAFGGHNPKRLSSPLVWASVLRPEEGFWQVGVASVRIGNQTLKACSALQCRLIIDSGTSAIGIHAGMLPELASALPVSNFLARGSTECIGPDLHLELHSGLQLTLKPQDYTHSVRSSSCKPRFSSLDGLPDSFEGVMVLGEPLLSRYYTVFDWTPGNERIAFGLAAQPQEDELGAVVRAEAAEDLQEASEVPIDDAVVSQFDVALVLFQNFLTRVLILICFIAFGTNQAAVKAFAGALESVASRWKLLEDVANFTTSIPGNDIPHGDECVICLGSCDDDPEVNMGVPGLQALSQCGDKCGDKAHVSTSTKQARWLRLRCGHHFHETCIFEWLRKTRHCPVCRRHMKDTNSINWGTSTSE